MLPDGLKGTVPLIANSRDLRVALPLLTALVFLHLAVWRIWTE